jgi:hypothetical protein
MDIEIRILELYKQVQLLQQRLDDIETQSVYSSNDTENLIAEEVHWLLKIFRKLFCYK